MPQWLVRWLRYKFRFLDCPWSALLVHPRKYCACWIWWHLTNWKMRKNMKIFWRTLRRNATNMEWSEVLRFPGRLKVISGYSIYFVDFSNYFIHKKQELTFQAVVKCLLNSIQLLIVNRHNKHWLDVSLVTALSLHHILIQINIIVVNFKYRDSRKNENIRNKFLSKNMVLLRYGRKIL